ncbi:MAG: hypothetical protein AAGF97_16530, partial [Planctomycetota bacterium]
MQRAFFPRYAALILAVTLFFAPFVLMGARLAISGMRNDVKDWLPEDFQETTDFEWFQERFPAESFVIVSWEGCDGTLDDERFRDFLTQFYPEPPPSAAGAAEPVDSDVALSEELGLDVREFEAKPSPKRAEWIGNRLQLYLTSDQHLNWGSENEKWLKGQGDLWYYLLPNGDLYRWNGTDSFVGNVYRGAHRILTGRLPLDGTRVASLGEVDGPWYYEDPQRLEADLFESVISGPSLLGDLVAEEGELAGDQELAMSRLDGILFGANGKQTCFVVALNELGRDDPHRVAGLGSAGRPRGKLLRMAQQVGLEVTPTPSQLPPPLNYWLDPRTPSASGPVLRMGGAAIDNIAVDEAGHETLVQLVTLSAILGILVSWMSVRSIRGTLLLTFVGGAGATVSLSLVWWSGSQMDAVLMSMPSLVYLLGLSGAVHIVNYYRDTVDGPDGLGSPDTAFQLGWKPCSMATLTTALGLVSLCTSNLIPIRKFGFFSAIALMATLFLVCIFLPAGLSIWPPFARRKNRPAPAEPSHRFDFLAEWGEAIAQFVMRRHRWVIGLCLIAFVWGACGLFKINTSVQLMGLFR